MLKARTEISLFFLRYDFDASTFESEFTIEYTVKSTRESYTLQPSKLGAKRSENQPN